MKKKGGILLLSALVVAVALLLHACGSGAGQAAGTLSTLDPSTGIFPNIANGVK